MEVAASSEFVSFNTRREWRTRANSHASLTWHVNPFRVASGRYRGRDRLRDDHPAAGRARLPAGRVNEGGLPVSSLQPRLQDQEILAPASDYRVRQAAAAQVSLLPSLQQVQSRHTEARHARTPGPAASGL